MRNNRLPGLVAFILALSVGGFLSAQTAATSAKPKPVETPIAHLTWRQIMEKLQLTSEQRQAVLKNRHAYRKEMNGLDSKIKDKQIDLEAELEKAEPDPTKLDLLAQEIGVLYGQRLQVKIKHKLELDKILMPQQLETLKALQGPSTEENI